MATLDILLNDQLYSLPPLFLVNGLECDLGTKLCDRDEVYVRLPRTVEEVVKGTGQTDFTEVEETTYTLNGKKQKWERSVVNMFVNNQLATLTSSVGQGDQIRIEREEKEALTIKNLIPENERLHPYIEVTFNGLSICIPIWFTRITINGSTGCEESPVHTGDDIMIDTTEAPPPIFSDVFRLTEVELLKPDPDSRLSILINGQPADFTSKIYHGDRLELRWDHDVSSSTLDPEHHGAHPLKN